MSEKVSEDVRKRADDLVRAVLAVNLTKSRVRMAAREIAAAEERGRRRGDAERDELRALLRDVQGWVDSRHATEHFDALAETFRKVTGNLPPGKSRPMEMGEELEQEREANRERWRAFNQTALAVVCARIDAALAPRDSGRDP